MQGLFQLRRLGFGTGRSVPVYYGHHIDLPPGRPDGLGCEN